MEKNIIFKIIASIQKEGIKITTYKYSYEEKNKTYLIKKYYHYRNGWEEMPYKLSLKKEKINKVESSGSSLYDQSYKIWTLKENLEKIKADIIKVGQKSIETYYKNTLIYYENRFNVLQGEE